MTTIIDGNTEIIGRLIDNILGFIANIFGGLANFGNTMGILIGVTFVIGLILVVTGKLRISKIVGTMKP